MLPLPAIALTASDYPRLEQLARVAAQQGDMDAMFLHGRDRPRGDRPGRCSRR